MALARNLEIVADDEKRDGHITFGVVYDGAFVPIGEVKTGHLTGLVGSSSSLALTADTPAASTDTADA